jgi:hypothetical protein
MADQIQKLREFKNWLNSEKFSASAYNYERNTILAALQIIEQKINAIEPQKVILSDDVPQEEIKLGDIWLDID